MNFKQIKAVIQEECKKHNVKFHHGRGKTVMFLDGIRSNGYFSPGNEGDNPGGPVLAVATNANMLDTMIHEYGHMQQFLENSPEWQDIDNKPEIWNWIGGEDGIDDDALDASCVAYYNIELDCEKRSVQLHKKWNTGRNLEEYIQKANAYTMFYFYMRHNRVWYKPGREPYSLKKVWSQMPKTFTFDRQKVYNKVHDLFKHCV